MQMHHNQSITNGRNSSPWALILITHSLTMIIIKNTHAPKHEHTFIFILHTYTHMCKVIITPLNNTILRKTLISNYFKETSYRWSKLHRITLIFSYNVHHKFWELTGYLWICFIWMAHKLMSSNNLATYVSLPSCSAEVAILFTWRSVANFWTISQTNHWNGRALMRSSILSWHWQIMQNVTILGLYFHCLVLQTPAFGLTLFTFSTIFYFLCLNFLGSSLAKGTLITPKYGSLWGRKVLIWVGLPFTLKYSGILVSLAVSEMMEGMDAPGFWVATGCGRKEV